MLWSWSHASLMSCLMIETMIETMWFEKNGQNPLNGTQFDGGMGHGKRPRYEIPPPAIDVFDSYLTIPRR